MKELHCQNVNTPAMPRKPSAPQSTSRFIGPIALLLVTFAAYASILIWETSFEVSGSRYFVLQDDSMISMRFARNLAHGHGFVWNVLGPRIEGFTNLLWVLVMAAFHLLPVKSCAAQPARSGVFGAAARCDRHLRLCTHKQASTLCIAHFWRPGPLVSHRFRRCSLYALLLPARKLVPTGEQR